MSIKTNFKILIIIILLLSTKVLSQPYTYYMEGSSNNLASLYRLNLSTSNSQLFLSGIPNYQGFVVDPTEQWVYINYGQGGTYLIIANVTDTSKLFYPLINQMNISGFLGVIYVSQVNKFYVTWLTPDTVSGTGDISETTIYDATNFKKLGNIDFGFTFSDIVSQDGRYIYQYAADSLGNSELLTFSTSTDSVVSTKPLLNVGPSTPDKTIEAGENNRLLLSWMHPGDNSSLNYYYSVYDVATGTNLPSINFPFICNASLSADGNYIILNTWKWIDTVENTGKQYFPGIIYVFNANTGKLKQRLSLPPGGNNILVIRSYSKMFYYYNDSTNQAVGISDTVVTPAEKLLDTLISLKEQAVNEGRIDNKGIANSLDSKLDNAKKKLAAGDSTATINILNAFVNEVEAQKGKHLTSEAYALLKYNAEYLINRLK